MKISKRTEQAYREPAVTTVEVGRGTRLGMLTINTDRVGDEEGRRGRNTEELNFNQNPD